jgi:hypothetical protein
MGDVHRVCPKCQSAMERGYLPDIAHGMVMRASWNPGEPEVRRFIGGIKWKPKESLPVTAYRCVKCGFVELYVED